MGFIRTYFDKDNVIMRNSCINTGRNPIAEIFHGGALTEDDLSFSRYLINFDLSDLINKYKMNQLPLVLEDIILDYKKQLDFKYIYIVEHLLKVLDEVCVYTAKELQRLICTQYHRNYHTPDVIKSLKYMVKYFIL